VRTLQEVDDIVRTVTLLAGSFGASTGGHLAPRCFEIERAQETCDIPIFHTISTVTAVVTLAGCINRLKVIGKKLVGCTHRHERSGGRGIAIIKLLMAMGPGSRDVRSKGSHL
jgi:malic enzyme